MSRYIIEYEVLHVQDKEQLVWSEMKAYPTIFTDKNIDEAKQTVNILSQINSNCRIVKLEVSYEKTEDDVYHHMFDAFKDNSVKQEVCDELPEHERTVNDYKEVCINKDNKLQELINQVQAPHTICAYIEDGSYCYWDILWLREPKDPEAMKTFYYYNNHGNYVSTLRIQKFIVL